ncbi:MAG: hypothetical protein A2051_05700 [Desulfovibrionales bacterium GWA2_65_9]|nr:MAG: hypothetical protein A2051_05700 [Desulfovibrionales bacterium GWA2_65_9]
MRRLRELLLLLPLAGCYYVIGRLNPELAPQIPLFLAFFGAFIVLPALGLGGLLVRLPLSLAERLALGGPAALATLFGLAYAGAALHAPLLVWGQPVLGLAAGLLSLLLARRGPAASIAASTAAAPAGAAGEADRAAPTSLPATPWPDLLIMLVVLALGLALCLPKFASVSAPLAETLVDYYNDDVATAGYVYSALRAMQNGLPVTQFMLAGVPLSYHLVYHYCYAACTQVTALHPLDLVIFLFPPALWLLLATAVVAGCRRLAGFNVLETVLAVVLLVFSAGLGFYSSHTVQLFAYQHTYFFCLPALILFLCLMYGYLTGRTERLFAFFGAVCFLVSAGGKANLLLLLPVSLLPVLVLRLFRRQIRLPEVLLAVLCLGSAVALRIMLFTDTTRAALHNPRLGKIFLGTLGSLWDMALVVGVYLVLAVLVAEASQPFRAKLDRARQYHLFAAGFILVSALMLKTFNFIGGDFYFYWQARLIVVLAFAPLAAHVFTWRTPRLVLVTALALVLGLLANVTYFLPPDVPNGRPQNPMDKVIDKGERAGLYWAADNLGHSKVFFTNKSKYLGYYLGGYIEHDVFDYLGLSGLQGHAWLTPGLEGDILQLARTRTAVHREFFRASTPEAAAQALARIDADYYIHCIRLGPVVVPDCLREVHRTASLIIYENTCRVAR